MSERKAVHDFDSQCAAVSDPTFEVDNPRGFPFKKRPRSRQTTFGVSLRWSFTLGQGLGGFPQRMGNMEGVRTSRT